MILICKNLNLYFLWLSKVFLNSSFLSLAFLVVYIRNNEYPILFVRSVKRVLFNSHNGGCFDHYLNHVAKM